MTHRGIGIVRGLPKKAPIWSVISSRSFFVVFVALFVLASPARVAFRLCPAEDRADLRDRLTLPVGARLRILEVARVTRLGALAKVVMARARRFDTIDCRDVRLTPQPRMAVAETILVV